MSSGWGTRALREGRAAGLPPAQAVLAELNAERLTDGLRHRTEIHRLRELQTQYVTIHTKEKTEQRK